MNKVKLMIIITLLCVSYPIQAKKKFSCPQPKEACAVQQCEPKRCALKPRTRRNQCPPPEYGLNCESCCYQAYGSPGYYYNAFRPYNGDGYFGRRGGNYNFTF